MYAFCGVLYIATSVRQLNVAEQVEIGLFHLAKWDRYCESQHRLKTFRKVFNLWSQPSASGLPVTGCTSDREVSLDPNQPSEGPNTDEQSMA